MTGEARVDFRVHPDQYRHWRLDCAGPVATLTMDVAEQGGLTSGYELKMNSTTWAWTSSCTTRCSGSASSTPRSPRSC
jgi:hypothetical protein